LYISEWFNLKTPILAIKLDYEKISWVSVAFYKWILPDGPGAEPG
jgi:hypothetical protein